MLQVEGAVTVQPYAEPIDGFFDYFLNLTPYNNQRNPWFGEYWEDYHQCRLEGTTATPFNHNYSTVIEKLFYVRDDRCDWLIDCWSRVCAIHYTHDIVASIQ